MSSLQHQNHRYDFKKQRYRIHQVRLMKNGSSHFSGVTIELGPRANLWLLTSSGHQHKLVNRNVQVYLISGHNCLKCNKIGILDGFFGHNNVKIERLKKLWSVSNNAMVTWYRYLTWCDACGDFYKALNLLIPIRSRDTKFKSSHHELRFRVPQFRGIWGALPPDQSFTTFFGDYLYGPDRRQIIFQHLKRLQ